METKYQLQALLHIMVQETSVCDVWKLVARVLFQYEVMTPDEKKEARIEHLMGDDTHSALIEF